MKTLIIGLPEIENIIISHVHYKYFRNILLINKSYKKIIEENILFKQYKELRLSKDIRSGVFFDGLNMLNLNLMNLFINYYNGTDIYTCFSLACQKKDLEIVKLIYSRDKHNELDIPTVFVNICSSKCNENTMLIIEWMISLLNKHYEYEQINKTFQEGFIEICKYSGNLEFVKFIHARTENIDYKLAFEQACKNDFSDIAQWLYSLGQINVDADDNYIFKWACKFGKKNIAQWLYSLHEMDIFMIRDLKDQCPYHIRSWFYELFKKYPDMKVITTTQVVMGGTRVSPA